MLQPLEVPSSYDKENIGCIVAASYTGHGPTQLAHGPVLCGFRHCVPAAVVKARATLGRRVNAYLVALVTCNI